MKKLVFLLVLVAMAWGAAPYVIGMQVEGRYDEAVAFTKKQLPPTVSFEMVSYERGYLNSTATSKLTIRDPNMPPLEFTFVDHIRQMPNFSAMSMASIETDVIFPAELQQAISEVIGDRKPVEINSTLAFDGTTTTTLHSAPFEISDNGGTFTWQGFDGTVTVSSDFLHSQGDITLPGFKFTQGDNSFTVSDIAVTVDTRIGSHDLTFGDSAVTIGNIHVVDTSPWSPAQINLDSFSLNSHADEKDGAASYEVSFATKGLTFNDIKTGDIALNLAMRNLDTKVLADIEEGMRTIMADPTNEQAQAQFGFAMMGGMPTLFGKHPEFEISRAYALLPIGAVEGHALFGIVGDWSPAIFAGDVEVLKNLFRVEFGFSAPESLVNDLAISQGLEQVQMISALSGEELTEDELYARAEAAASQQLFALTSQGMLKFEDGVYSTEMSYNAGKLLVNGQDMSALLSQLPM